MKRLFFLILITINIYGYEPFVSAATLKSSLDDQNLVIIDVSKSYKKSHIIGAHSLDVDKLTLQDRYKNLIDQDDLQEIFRDFGINNNSDVVIYGRNTDEDLQNSAFLAYVLISNGFENVSILDGGYMAWVFKYDLFTTIEDADTQEGSVVLEMNNLTVDFNDLKDNAYDLIIDARYPQKYYGISNNEDDKYIGHIPSAKNSYYKYKFLRDKTLRPQDELDEFYKDGLNIEDAKDIVIYADSAKEAAMEWYIIYKRLGYKNAKIYYNSFREYVDWELKTERFKWE